MHPWSKPQVGYFPGFLVISLGDPETLKQSIQLVKVDSGLDLYRLTRIYQLFESILCDEISLKEATHMLDPILLQPSLYPQWMIILAYGVSSSTSTSLFFTGNHADMFIGFFLGIFVAVGYLNVSRHVTRFASIFDVLISAVVGFLAAAISTRLSSTTSCFYALSIGGIVSLLPGYATLISLLELAAGSIMAGTLRLTTTLVYSLLLGFGLAIGSSVHEFLWPSLIFKSSESVCTAGLSAYYHILLVPLFAAANIVILCGHPRKFPIMLILAILAHSVQYISLESLVTYRHLATVLASFVVGFSANIYARLCSTVGFVDMIAGLLFLVPGSVGVTSSLGSFGQMLTTGNTIAEVFVIAHAGQQGIVFAAHMLVITVSISLGLVLAAVAIYPLRKIMDFRYQTSHRTTKLQPFNIAKEEIINNYRKIGSSLSKVVVKDSFSKVALDRLHDNGWKKKSSFFTMEEDRGSTHSASSSSTIPTSRLPYPISQLRKSALPRRFRRKSSHIDDALIEEDEESSASRSQDVQAALEQLTKTHPDRPHGSRQNSQRDMHPLTPTADAGDTTKPSYFHSPAGHALGNPPSSLTQRLIDRGVSVPSSVNSSERPRSTTTINTDNTLSSSLGSFMNDFDSSAYYGLSPYVGSSFSAAPDSLLSNDSDRSSQRYRSLRHRYEREHDSRSYHLSEEDDEVVSSPEPHKVAHPSRMRGRSRLETEDSDIELSDEDIVSSGDATGQEAESSPTTYSPLFLNTPDPRRWPSQVYGKTRSPSPLAYATSTATEQSSHPLSAGLNNKTEKSTDSDSRDYFDMFSPSVSLDAEERMSSSSYATALPSCTSKTSNDEYFTSPRSEKVASPVSPQRPLPPSLQHLSSILSSPSRSSSIFSGNGTDALWRLNAKEPVSQPKEQPPVSPLDRPPRCHLLQTPVFQVVNVNTVKDRYLFLFNDLLVICKPIMDENIIVSSASCGPDTNATSDRNRDSRYRFRPTEKSLFQVKNIVELSKVTLYMTREDQYTQQQQQQQNQQRRLSLAVGPDGRPMLPQARKMHPVLASALRKFESSAKAGIEYLKEKQILTNEPLTIANFLFKTPDLNRRQLGYYLADPENSDIYESFLDCFRLVGLRLDEALRILLTTFRLPSRWELLEYIIERFAKKWHDSNQNVVKFHEDMVVKVVVAMLFLNAEVWYDASSERDVFWYARERKEREDRQRFSRRASVDRKNNRESVAIEPLHYIAALRAQGTAKPDMQDFLERWNYYDQYTLVPREFMEDMYRSIIEERLETGWDNKSDCVSSSDEEGTSDKQDHEVIITVIPHRLPTRLTKGIASEPITISIPAPDPGLQIKLRGQDLVCEPNVLDFSTSCFQTFTITGNTLGRTSLMFIKSGSHAGRYVSPALPRTKNIVVERPFMRYTFHIAFNPTDIRTSKPGNQVVDRSSAKHTSELPSSPLTIHSGHMDGPEEPELPLEQEPASSMKRKYTFSVETEEERHAWVHQLRHLCGTVMISDIKQKCICNSKAVKTFSAEERVALQVLKEVLLADEVKKGTAGVAGLRTNGGNAGRADLNGTNSVASPSLNKPGLDEAGWSVGAEEDKEIADDKMMRKSDRGSLMSVASGATNVVTKRGHEIVKLVVQNSLVPLMLGFLRAQIPS
ncbi:uncharacterized protein BYT42DRAFT_546603 [Radiomyces spectabilis]|uniref:uncharacterized protein n=1 Tax=Radiomyces spectabilis TaxID=64574 RepID=UPI002220E79D|nr:uncharacterized protein BYT42DRAFT_546603 [Radiomyces spectabilis]KAI8378014.1 hypothetical protein BYT42DRAFT_546603 [Radiomyces spectabilis]